MTAAVTAEVLATWPPPPVVAERWRELAVARENLFVTPEWIDAWTRDAATTPVVLVAREGDRVLGILPLVRRGPGGRRLEFAGAAAADVLEPLCDAGREAEAADAWRRCLAEQVGVAALALDRLADLRWFRLLAGVSPARLRVVPSGAPAVLPFVDLGAGYEAWRAGRSRNFRSQLGRRRRQLERRGGLRLRMASTAEDVDRDMATLFDLHQRRWAARGGSEALPDALLPAHRRFARSALEQGWLRLWTMELDGRPVAAWYGWRCGTRYAYYQSGFDPEAGAEGLGTVMLDHTIRDAAADGATIYDMLWGDESYKERFATGRRILPSAVLVDLRRPAGLASAAAVVLRRRARELPPELRAPLRRAYRQGRRLTERRA